MEFFAKSSSTGLNVHISDSEKGTVTLVLLHGYLETLCIWEEFREEIRQLRTIAIDLPGHGLSGTHPEINTMEACADVVRDVLDICHVEKAYIGGHSMGGYVAQQFCKSYPERASGLILFNSNPFADSPQKKLARLDEVEAIRGGAILNIAAAMIPKMYAPDNLRKCDDKINETVYLCDTHDPEGIMACCRGLAERSDYCDMLKDWKKPTLFIYGDKDPFLDAEKLNAMMEYESFEHLLIPLSAHNSFVEKPETVVEKVLKICQ